MNKRIEQAIIENMGSERRIRDIGETMACWESKELNKMIELNIIQRLIIKIKEIINGLK